MRDQTFVGYDGNGYTIGDRVELHPGCDLWMRGARYGTVEGAFRGTPANVGVRMDAFPNKILRAPEDRFRNVDGAL